MPASELRKRWQSGAATYGASVRMNSAWAVHVLAQHGLDFLKIDLQHGMNELESLTPMVFAALGSQTTLLARVPAAEPALVARVLDAGVDGIVVPMVNNPDEAAQAVAAMTPGADGVRSVGTMLAKYLPGGPSRETLCLVMIETLEGIRNVDAIASVPGVDGITIGLGDLAFSLGITPNGRIQPGPHEEAVEEIVRVCRARSVAVGATGDPAEIVSRGFNIVTLGGDNTFFEDGLKAALARRPAVSGAASAAAGNRG